MTNREVIEKYFDEQYELWLQFHNMPLSYTRGLPMRITDKHLKAIARAQHFVRSGITAAIQAHHREQLENDIFLLDQVHTFCRQQINEPGLPMTPEPFKKSCEDPDNGPSSS